MKRPLAGMLALWLAGLAAPALGAPRHTHTHRARVSGRIVSPVLRPAPPACRGNRARDSLGRCPSPPACPGDRPREPGGQCPTIFCAGGALPDAFGRCHAPARPRLAACPGGALRTPAGDCPTPMLCPGGLPRNPGGVCPFFAPRFNGLTPRAPLAPHPVLPALRPAAPTFVPPSAPHPAPPPLRPAPRIHPAQAPPPRIAPALAH